eukprot:TRINITY_DN29348_c0_g1_i11.p1 TRINITY_DN29348_c0_g1~~TRINITY_DN29348_c0_g1_i11.p1  ORF type:complete len:176 (+),score=8.70 TRINITY_DN29348_c0_g1_i11:268-795(+)
MLKHSFLSAKSSLLVVFIVFCLIPPLVPIGMLHATKYDPCSPIRDGGNVSIKQVHQNREALWTTGSLSSSMRSGIKEGRDPHSPIGGSVLYDIETTILSMFPAWKLDKPFDGLIPLDSLSPLQFLSVHMTPTWFDIDVPKSLDAFFHFQMEDPYLYSKSPCAGALITSKASVIST